MRGQHTNIILDYHETRFKQRHLRYKIKTHLYGPKRLVPEQPYGQG